MNILCTFHIFMYGYGTQFLSRIKWLELDFSISLTGCLTKAKEPRLSYYLSIDERSGEGFMPFPKVLVRSVTEIASSRIWTRAANFISYDDNLCAKRAS